MPEKSAIDKSIVVEEGTEGESIVVVPEGAEDETILEQEGTEGESIAVVPEQGADDKKCRTTKR